MRTLGKSDILNTVEPLFQAFEQLKIPFCICGSVASSMEGLPRTTLDVDVVADLDHDRVAPLVSEIEGIYYVEEASVREAVTHRSHFNVVHLGTMMKVDIFLLRDEPFYKESFSRSRAKILFEDEDGAVRCLVNTPEDIVLHKLLWYEKGGGVSERQWIDLLGVLKIHRGRLEMDYLENWASLLSLEALLKRALREAGITTARPS